MPTLGLAELNCCWTKLWISKPRLITQTGQPDRPLATFKRKTGFHIQFSNLSHPGSPVSTDNPHSEQAVLRLSLQNSRGRGGEEKFLSAL